MCNYLTYFFVRDFVVDYATCRRLHASPLFALPPDAKYRVNRAAIYHALGKSTRVEDKRMFALLSSRVRVNVSRTAIGVQVRLAYTPTHTRLPRALQYREK